MVSEQVKNFINEKRKILLSFNSLLQQEEKIIDGNNEESFAAEIEQIFSAKEEILAQLRKNYLAEQNLLQELNSMDEQYWLEEKGKLTLLIKEIQALGQENIKKMQVNKARIKGNLLKIKQNQQIVKGYELAYGGISAWFVDKRR